MKICVLFLILFSFFGNRVYSQVVYVNSIATGLNDGSSWTNAYTNLSNAINNTTSGEIWVGAGTYKPTLDRNGVVPVNSKDLTFPLKNNVAIYGGFNGTETLLSQRNLKSNLVVLSGDLDGDNNLDDPTDAGHVVTGVEVNNTAIIDGVNITGGISRLTGYMVNNGGGMVLVASTNSSSCSPIVRNCHFYNNLASDGGAIAVIATGTNNTLTPIFENCFIRGNKAVGTAGSKGGAFYILNGTTTNVQIIHCTILNNISNNNGQIYGGTTQFKNSILWIWGNNNSGGTIDTLGILTGTHTIQNSILWKNTCGTCSNTDPLFHDPDGPDDVMGTIDDDPSLMANSSGIDFGNNAFASTKDIFGDLRIKDSDNNGTATVDAGCVENNYIPFRPIIYVKWDATGSNDGTSWANAYTNLQSGIRNAEQGTQVWVSAGTYKPHTSNPTYSFNLKNGIEIYGGFNGTETLLSQRNFKTNVTILNGDYFGDDVVGNQSTFNSNNPILVRGTDIYVNAILDGFTLTHSKAPFNFYSYYGTKVCSTQISNCEVTFNYFYSGLSSYYGSKSNLNIFNSNFYNNGGSITSNAFYINTNTTINIDKCTFSAGDPPVWMTSSDFAKLEVNISNSTFLNTFRWALLSGAGNSSRTVYNVNNCLFYKMSFGAGYGIFETRNNNNATSRHTFTNCDFVNLSNASGLFRKLFSGTTSTDTIQIRNSIVYNNTYAATYSLFYSTGSGNAVNQVDYSNVQGYVGPGTGNIDLDPQFSIPYMGNYADLKFDYNLLGSSPCKNSGNNAFSSSTFDYAGNTRIQESIIDMGCYESFPCTNSGSRLYVNASVTGGDGSTWALAFNNLQDALIVARKCSNINEIWVAAGSYKPHTTDKTEAFYMKSNLAIYGGFNGTETLLNQRDFNVNLSILSSDFLGDDTPLYANMGENAFRTVCFLATDSTSILDGLVIKGSNSQTSSIGAGILLFGSISKKSNPTLNNLTVSDHYQECILAQGNSRTSLYIQNSKIINNRLSGISALTDSIRVYNCLFQNNAAYSIQLQFINNQYNQITNCKFNSNKQSCIYMYYASSNLKNCEFTNNAKVGNEGAAIYAWAKYNLLVDSCYFENNSCSVSSGGTAIYLGTHGGYFLGPNISQFTNSTFRNHSGVGTSVIINHAQSGASCNLSFDNCLFENNNKYSIYPFCYNANSLINFSVKNSKFISNTSNGIGLETQTTGTIQAYLDNNLHSYSTSSQIYTTNSAGSINMRITNSTIYNGNLRFGQSGGGVSNIKVSNSIHWGTLTLVGSNNLSVDHSDFQNSIAGIGNISINPQFVNTTTGGNNIGNFRLLSNSPCLNSGINDSVFVANDLDGFTRIQGTAVDMGCYESSNNPLDTVGKVRSQMTQFNGSQKLTMNSDLNLVKNKFTFEFWARPTNTHEIDLESNVGIDGVSGQKYLLFPVHGGTQNAGFGISLGTNGLAIYEHGDGFMPPVLVYSADLSTWHHYAITYNHGISAPQLFVDGVLVKTGQISTKLNIILSTDIGQGAYGFYEGFLDEISIWDTVLSQDRIREKMHLTKLTAERNLVAYYQFNETTAKDHVKGLSSTLSGSMIWSDSEVPVAFGTSQKLNVVASGNYNFSQANTQINFANPTTPNGEIWTYNLQETPHGYASIGFPGVDNEYYVVRNFGSNSTFTQLNNITFINVNSIAATDVATPSIVRLYKRNSNEYGPTWNFQAAATSLVSGTNGTVVLGGTNNITSFSQFVLVSIGSSSLPVEYESFTANRQTIDKVNLNWNTSMENNNLGFDVLRKLDNETEFTKVGFVSASQNKVYSFLDNNDYEGISYYQLKQMDFDGNANFSEIREVNGWDKLNVNIYPNPFENELVIDCNVDSKVKITNVLGVVIFEGQNVKTLNTSTWPNGTYIVKIESGRGEVVKKLVK